MDDYARQLLESHPLREEVLRGVIQRLDVPRGSHGLDAGCGIGVQFPALLEALGDDGRLTGLDLSADFLRIAGELAGESGLEGRITLRQGDVGALPFDDDSFDWAWSMDCIGYHPMDPMAPLRELRRVVRPGGTIALAMWSSQRLLPGYPLLEAKLDAAPGGIASFEERESPGQHYLRALGWLRQLGLSELRATTAVGTVQAPCSKPMRRSLELFYDMLWAKAAAHLSGQERETYRALTDPRSSDFIADSSDYFGFFTYSMFAGVVGSTAAAGAGGSPTRPG